MSTAHRRLDHLLALAIVAVITGCGNSPGPQAARYHFPVAPIAPIALDDYASGGILTVPPGTEFGVELSGSGWSIPAPQKYEPFRLVRGPGDWFPDLGYIGPGNCDSASPCGGVGAIFKTTTSGYGNVLATSSEGIVFDLHLVVKQAPISVDLLALPILNEAIGSSVTMPVGSAVNVHVIGNWGTPVPDSLEIGLFAKDNLATSGVVVELARGHVLNESVYSYAISGKGAYAYDFKYLDPSPFAQGYTIGFDIP